MATFRDAFELAKRFLGDPRGIKIKEGSILYELTEAHRMVQRKLADHGIGTLFVDAALTIPALTTSVAFTVTSPVLPADMIVPHHLKEKQGGQSGYYISMDRRDQGLPSIAQTSTLRLWRWITNQIELIGATRVVDVVLTYEKMLPEVSLLTDSILVRTGAGAVAHATAFLVNGTHYAEFENQCDMIINSEVRATQEQGMRRIPYGRSWR